MKVFVTGVNGQLGHDVMVELASRGIYGIGSGRSPVCTNVQKGSPVASMPYIPLDITDADKVNAVLTECAPDAVIHCAAWTNVDAAEAPEHRKQVFEINVTGTNYIADSCARLGCKIAYISTDYVFNGEGTTPWPADCTGYGPLSFYGYTKLMGEQAVRFLVKRHFIVRISWVFGMNGGNFVKTMLRLADTHDTLRVVNDQIGTPTYTRDIARLLVDMALSEAYGSYHASNEGGFISWADFAEEIFRQEASLRHLTGLRCRVIPVTTAEYGLSKAERPKNSRLDKCKLKKAGFTPLPEWRDALRRYLSAYIQCC